MKTHAEKIIASILATLAPGFIILMSVLPGWALSPPRLNVSSAVLTPLGHIGMRWGINDSLIIILAAGPIITLGCYLGWAWIRGLFKYALVISIFLYGLAVSAAFWSGVDWRYPLP